LANATDGYKRERNISSRVSAVVVDYHAGDALGACIDSLHANGVTHVSWWRTAKRIQSAALAQRDVVLVTPG